MDVGIVLRLCSDCMSRAAAHLAMDELRRAVGVADLADAVQVETCDCLGACDAPAVLALQGAGRAAYVFVGVSLPADAADVAATCRLYRDSPGGWIVDARPCGRLRLCLRTRVPAPR